MASKNVDLPAPFAPTINVAGLVSNCISLNTLPVERKFFQRTVLKIIIKTKLISRGNYYIIRSDNIIVMSMFDTSLYDLLIINLYY